MGEKCSTPKEIVDLAAFQGKKGYVCFDIVTYENEDWTGRCFRAKLVFEEIPLFDSDEGKATMQVKDSVAQKLLNQLWKCGLRPDCFPVGG